MRLIVTDKGITEYLQGKDLNEYAQEWYFSDIRPFTKPAADPQFKEKVKKQYACMQNQTRVFHPLNRPSLDRLFPGWQEESVTVDLIVGFPAPYDAVAETAPDGKVHIVLDVVQFTDYDLTEEQSEAVMRNLLTHEFVHILMEKRFPGLTDGFGSSEYTRRMDALVFNEGIAHLLSYKSRELDETDWTDAELQDLYARSKQRLRAALCESNKELQTKRLEEAVTGSYYEKFGAMSGMLYFAEKWNRNGISGLEQELETGADHVTNRILGMTY